MSKMMYMYRNNFKKNRNTKLDDSESEENDDSKGDNEKNEHISREDNHIYFHSEVNRRSVFKLLNNIRSAEESCILMKHRFHLEEIPIYLHINSFGGSIFDALSAIDVINSCKIPIYTIIEGATASAGTLISVVGKKRFIRPNAYMLIHQLSSGYWGKMAEMEDEFKNLQSLTMRIKNIYKENASIPKKELGEILKHDIWWDIEKCMQYGLVDEVWEE